MMMRSHAFLVRCVPITWISQIYFKLSNTYKSYLILYDLENVKNKSDLSVIQSEL